LAVLLALLAGGLVTLALAEPSTAATPCGKKVLADWFDNGRIDRLYPLHCYEEAIDAIPADIRDYADAEEVISRALQAAVSGKLAAGGCDPSPDGSANDCTRGLGGAGGSGGSGGSGEEGSGGSGGGGSGSSGEGGSGSSGSGSEATPTVDTSGPSSVPIPLLVLGGMSIALLLAGGVGYMSRRRQAADLDDHDDLDG
jgi:hypothetical protein